MAKKMIPYYRVSTKKQGKSGLGLAAQKKTAAEYAAANSGKIIAEFREVEAGPKCERPKLAEAIEQARLSKAILVIAKLEGLTRNIPFMSALKNSGVEFAACDNPHANRSSIEVLASMADWESMTTSRRSKDALAAAKARGTKLGSARPGHWKGREHLRGFKKGSEKSAKVRSQRAAAAYSFLVPRIKQMHGEGKSLSEIADALNNDGHQTTAAKPFTAVAVWRIIKRYGSAA